ncbi:MAG: hypothetical protein ACOC7V_15545 [Spirochaetota bacterium]
MRTSSPGRTRREGGYLLLDALLAVVILLVAIGAAALTARAAAGAMVRQAERLHELVERRNELAAFEIDIAADE